jgi:hypothetical protein
MRHENVGVEELPGHSIVGMPFEARQLCQALLDIYTRTREWRDGTWVDMDMRVERWYLGRHGHEGGEVVPG